MGDIFNEQIIKKEPTIQTNLLKALLIGGALILSLLSLIFLGQFSSIVIVVVLFAAYYVMGFMNVEYEYTYTNGELDIDVIYSKTRRKRLFSGDVGAFEIMSHVDDKEQVSYYSGAEATCNYSSGTTKENTYRFVTMYKGKKTVIVFEPNEKLIRAISTKVSRRKLIIREK